MARKKRLRTVQSNNEYLSQAHARAELNMESELPAEDVDVVIQGCLFVSL
jgi:hypothetical protein